MKTVQRRPKQLYDEYVRQARGYCSEDDRDYEALTKVIRDYDDVSLVELLEIVGGLHVSDAI